MSELDATTLARVRGGAMVLRGVAPEAVEIAMKQLGMVRVGNTWVPAARAAAWEAYVARQPAARTATGMVERLIGLVKGR